MANKAISELPQAQNVNNQDLFVLEQSGIAKKLTAETFITEQGIIDALAEALDGHGGISSVTLSSVSGRVRTYRITFTDGSATTFQVYDGTTIERIAKTSTAGLVDTYTVFMNDGTTTFFTVTNGADGTVSEAMLNDALKNKAPVITETTESSAIATFTDGADDMAMHNVVAEINPVQDLTYGDPYPAGSHYNQWDEDWESGTISGSNGQPQSDDTRIRSKNFDACLPSTQYYCVNPLGALNVAFYDANKAFLSMSGDASNKTFTTPADCYFFKIRVVATSYTSGIAINYPSSVTTYSPYANICPISGWAGCNVTRTGKNLFDPTNVVQGSINGDNGVPFGSTTRIRSDNFISLKQGTYTISANEGFNIAIYIYGTDESYIISESYRAWSVSNQRTIILVGDRKVLFIFRKADDSAIVPSDLTTPMLELGSTATAYEPYQGTTLSVDWSTEAGTVYGGTIDVATGLLTVTHKYATYNGTENWDIVSSNSYLVLWNQTPSVGNYDLTQMANWLVGGGNEYNKFGKFRMQSNGALCVGNIIDLNTSDYKWANASEFKAYLADNPLSICYAIATPQTYQLSGQQLMTLLGTNNVWTDIANVSVKYPADTKMYIDNAIAALA